MSLLFIASSGQLYADPTHIIEGVGDLDIKYVKQPLNKDFYECILYFVTI